MEARTDDAFGPEVSRVLELSRAGRSDEARRLLSQELGRDPATFLTAVRNAAVPAPHEVDALLAGVTGPAATYELRQVRTEVRLRLGDRDGAAAVWTGIELLPHQMRWVIETIAPEMLPENRPRLSAVEKAATLRAVHDSIRREDLRPVPSLLEPLLRECEFHRDGALTREERLATLSAYGRFAGLTLEPAQGRRLESMLRLCESRLLITEAEAAAVRRDRDTAKEFTAAARAIERSPGRSRRPRGSVV